MNAANKVFVTGGTGFIGRYLVDALCASGSEVTCMVRNEAGRVVLKGMPVKFVQGDITGYVSFTGLGEFDYVYHVAGSLTGIRRADFVEVNVAGTRNLLEALARAGAPPKRIIHISSISAAGPSQNAIPKPESDPPAPISLYGVTKLAGEEIARSYMDRLPITILRPALVYGPWDVNAVDIYRMVHRGVVLVPPRQPKLYSVIHACDLARIMIAIAQLDGTKGEIINIATETPCSWDEIINLMAQALSKAPARITLGKLPFYLIAAWHEAEARLSGGRVHSLTLKKLPELFAQYWWADTYKLYSILGHTCQVNVGEGVRETAIWYKAQGWL
jgi:dihydroflavonol-4-reductase